MPGGLEIPGISCDGCSKTLLIDESVRYVVDIRVYAAYDPMEIMRADYEKDHGEEIARLIEACQKTPAQELEDQVYREFRFHLCPPCQRRYLQDPIGRGAPSTAAGEVPGAGEAERNE